MKDKKEKKEKSKFNLAFDNLAIPEVHIEELHMVKEMWNISIRMRTERWRKRL